MFDFTGNCGSLNDHRGHIVVKNCERNEYPEQYRFQLSVVVTNQSDSDKRAMYLSLIHI